MRVRMKAFVCVIRRLWISDLLSVFSILAASVEISKMSFEQKIGEGCFYPFAASAAINNQLSSFSFISTIEIMVTH